MRCEPVPNPTRPCRKPLPRVSSPLTLTRPRDHKPHLVWGVHSGWGLRLHPLHWQAKEARLEPECWVPSRVSPSAPSLAGSSPGQGPQGGAASCPAPLTPASLQKCSPPPCSTRNSGLYSAARLTRGKRKTNPQTEAKQPHTCHHFPWWIFPLLLSAEEPANLEKGSGWGLGSLSPGLGGG